MALFATHNETKFGVGDVVRVNQKITEGDKSRVQTFEGVIMRIKGREMGKSILVRRIGAQQVGIERIYPLHSPIIQSIEVVRNGTRGIKRSKLYYTRDKSRKEINKIYSRANRREEAKKAKPSSKEVHKKLVEKTPTKVAKKTAVKKVSPKKTTVKKTVNAKKA